MKTYEQLQKSVVLYRVLLIISWLIILFSYVEYGSTFKENTVLQKGVVKLSATVDMDTVDIISLQERVAELESANEELIKLLGARK